MTAAADPLAPAVQPPLRARVRDWLPRGQALPETDWQRRNRALVLIVWLHALLLPIFGLTQDVRPAVAVVETIPIALAAVAGSLSRASRRARAVSVVFGLLTSSAVLVSDWHGQIEAHFSYFVMIAIIALYEDWVPFLVAIGYVVFEHGVMSAFFPNTVFTHSHPWAWAAIHGGFVLAASAAAVVTWRLNEDLRGRMDYAVRLASASAERLRVAFDGGVAGMALVAPDGRYLRVNPALCEMVGYSADELLDSTFQTITHPADLARDEDAYQGLLDGSISVYTTEKRYMHRDGHDVWAHVGITAVREDDELSFLIVQSTDVTERHRFESELAHQAMHDPLTGLPNRTLFRDRVDHALARLARHGGRVVVLYVDLDRFKLVNDGMGHAVGDAVLREAGERLTAAAREEDTVARLGGDEFTVLCEDIHDTDVMTVAQRILDVFAHPFVVDDREFELSTSVGVRCVDAATSTTDDVLREADMALYEAKSRGRARYHLYDAENAASVIADRLATEHDLRQALRNSELFLHYQPEIDIKTGATVAVEALVRWQHPTRGLVPPGDFIPTAEESDLIVELGQWVLTEACTQVAQWLADAVVPAGIRIAVNVSARQLSRPEFPASVAETLRATGLPARHLCIEITESAVISDAEVALANLREIKAQGVLVAIDDFGIGFSSLEQLRALPPIDIIKIDRSFVSGLGQSLTDDAVVGAVVSLAHSLGVDSVAEGIEEPEQLTKLLALGCDLGQGYYFARPQSAEALIETLRAGQAAA